MASIPTKRIAVYIGCGLVVLAVGSAGLLALRGNGLASTDALVIQTDASFGAQGDGAATLAGTDLTTTVESSTSTTQAQIWVQVAGAVRRPGVYRLVQGTRVFEAVSAAGGFAADADQQAVALAALLSDGCRVYVPSEGETPAGPPDSPTQSSAGVSGGSSGVGGSANGGLVSLNSATAEQLDSLPGVGPSLALQIIAYREKNGPFTSVDQLDEVPGIGPAKLEQLRPLVGL